MTSPNDSNRAWERIAAFADGELNPEECCDLLREAAEQPDVAKSAEHQRQLRKLLAGCMDCEVTMRCPDELKNCIEGIADDCGRESDAGSDTASPDTVSGEGTEPVAQIGPGSGTGMPGWGWAVAAALMLAVAVGLYVANGPIDPSTNLPTAARQPAGAGLSLATFADENLENLVTRHVRCAVGVSHPMATEAFSGDTELLAQQVSETLSGVPLPVRLDLERAGLTLRLAGRCVAPGPGAMHLIYDARSADNQAPPATVSLWIKPYHAELDPLCTPGELEVLAGDGRPHPVLLWRDDHFMYVLVGDAMEHVTKAQATLTAADAT